MPIGPGGERLPYKKGMKPAFKGKGMKTEEAPRAKPKKRGFARLG